MKLDDVDDAELSDHDEKRLLLGSNFVVHASAEYERDRLQGWEGGDELS